MGQSYNSFWDIKVLTVSQAVSPPDVLDVFLKWSFTTCRLANSSGRIFLHKIGFPAILTLRVTGEVGDKQQTSVKDVEHDKHTQLMLVWSKAPGYLYPDMRNGAYEKCNDYVS